MNGFLGGLTVRRMEQGQVPVADHLCTRCGHHRRAAGRELVRDFLASEPITQHRADCRATRKEDTDAPPPRSADRTA